MKTSINEPNRFKNKSRFSIDHSFTKLNSKELFRAFKELNGNEFIVYLTMNRVVTQFNNNSNFRKIGIPEILSEIPINISRRSLLTYFKSLRDKGFITNFSSSDTHKRTNVYSLVNRASTTNYSLIENHILTDICSIINNANDYKVYLLIFSGLMLFSKDTFSNKSLYDLARLIGKKPTKAIRDSIKSSIKSLMKLNLIDCYESQKHFLAVKKLSFSINLSWRKDISSDSIDVLIPENADRVGECVQKIIHDDANLDTGKCKNNDSFKKESILESKLESNKTPSCNKATVNTKESHLLKNPTNDLNFNFFGLDKLNNPLNIISIKTLLKSKTLDIQQIQLSVERFSVYINSRFYDNRYTNPVAFLYRHLSSFGEYVPPEEYLANVHKDKDDSYKGIDMIDLIKDVETKLSAKDDEEAVFICNEIFQASEDIEPLIDNEIMQVAKEKLDLFCRIEGIFGALKKGILKNHIETAAVLVENNIKITMESLTNPSVYLTLS